MNDNLIETMARAMYWDETPSGGVPWDNLKARDRIAWIDPARAAFAAIEASGYRVVPVYATADCLTAICVTVDELPLGQTEEMLRMDAGAVYAAMLAAAPKVTE